ncbi:MAG: toxin-antitoxin system HicB family antitoxin [Armatimonadetes bacterium]|jgi:hypothetical protein|nr:toxin-antitoxin system HicB family antitoxin [Armatimonadota bacterium]
MAPRKSFLLRISPELWEALERMAADEFRSVNAQIEYLLREALQRRGRLPRASADAQAEASPPNAGDE